MLELLQRLPVAIVIAVVLLLFGCGGGSSPSGPAQAPPPTTLPDFSLSVTPNTDSMQEGATQQFQVMVTALHDFTGQVAVSVAGLPDGVTAPANVVVMPGVNGTIALTAATNAALGSTPVTFTGTSGRISHTVSVSLSVTTPPPPPMPDFSLSAPPAVTLQAGGTTNQAVVSVTSIAGFNSPVTVTLVGLPTGVTESPSSVTLTSGTSGTITFNAARAAVVSTSTLTLTANSGSLSHTANIILSVTPPADFTLSVSPGTVTIQGGGSTQFSVSNLDTNGFNEAIGVALTGLPPGVSAQPSTLSLTGIGQSVTLTATPTATLGNVVLTLTGSAGGITHTVTVPISVLVQPTLAINVYPATFDLAPGLSQTLTISATDSNALANTVSVILQGLPFGIQVSPTSLSLSPGTPQQLVFTAGSDFTKNGTATLQALVDDVSETQELTFNVLPASTSLVTSGLMAYFPMGEGSGRTIQDASGNGYTGTFGGSDNTWAAAGVSFDGHGWIDLPAALNSAQTIQMWTDLSIPHPNGGEAFIGTTAATADSLAWLLGNQQFVLQNQSGFGAISATPFTGSATLTLVEGNSGHNTDDGYWINGNEAYVMEPTGSRSGDLSLTGHFQLAASAGTNGLTGTIGPVAFYNRPLTADEIALNSAFFNAIQQSRGIQTQEGDQSTQNQFIAMGDSITFGLGADHPYCYYLNEPSFNSQCLGYIGQLTSLGVQQAPQFANYYNAQSKQNIFFDWYVTNDEAAGETTDEILQNLSTSCNEVKAIYPGWKVLIGTMMSRVIVPEAQRYAYNDAVREQLPQGCDGYIDVAADPALGSSGAWGDSYFFDQTHPNTQGQQHVAAMVTSYINSMMGATVINPTRQSNATYVMTSADNYAVAAVAGDGTWSLPECLGLTSKQYTVMNQGTGALSFSSANSETITGSDTIAPNATGIFEAMLTSDVTAGCGWVRK